MQSTEVVLGSGSLGRKKQRKVMFRHVGVDFFLRILLIPHQVQVDGIRNGNARIAQRDGTRLYERETASASGGGTSQHKFILGKDLAIDGWP